MVYTFHSDNGHGWLQVGKDELVMLGIENSISGYSYRNNNNVFLEEDCDASLFVNAMENKGVKISYKYANVDGDSFIRSLRRYY
jgi:hypothetical protein